MASATLVRLAVLVGIGQEACSSSTDSGSEPASNYNVGGQSSNNTPETISFSPAGTVLLKPGETGYRTVLVQPAGTYDVGLALLGASNDASLSKTVIRTGSDGRGQFSVTASSVATSFKVRASIGRLSQQLDVSVSAAGYATLNVSGTYSGARSVMQWAATLWSGSTCSDFGSTLPVNGELLIRTAAKPNIPVGDVPVGATQAIVMQGDSSIWGCRDVPGLVAGEALDLPVQIYDIPATFGSTPIAADFLLTTNAATWSTNLSSADSNLVQAVEQSANNDVDLLLDSMRAAVTDATGQDDFDQRRSAGNWHSIVSTRWSSLAGGDEALSTAITDWLTGASNGIGGGITVSTGLTLTSTSSSLGQEQLNLKSIAGISAAELEAGTAFPLTTSFGANDGLAASASISFNEAYLIRALAIGVAQKQYAGANDIPGALALRLDCSGLAALLDAAAASTSGCNAGCLADLCTTGLIQLWQRSTAAADRWTSTKLTMSCSGTLTVDPNAVVTGYGGSWVGVISSPSGNVTTGGTID